MSLLPEGGKAILAIHLSTSRMEPRGHLEAHVQNPAQRPEKGESVELREPLRMATPVACAGSVSIHRESQYDNIEAVASFRLASRPRG